MILQGVEFSIFVLILAWALQQCSATALPVILFFFYYLFSNQAVLCGIVIVICLPLN